MNKKIPKIPVNRNTADRNTPVTVLAINASPHKGAGNTALILDPFLEGMKETGARVELVYTEDLSVHSCRGDLVCFCRKSGRCVQSDDMDWLVPKARNADVIVFASPLYTDGVTGPMKTLIDRLVPLETMAFEIHNDHCRHVPRDERARRIVLVSNCGLWERDNFDPVIAHMKALARNMNAAFAGALVRPHGVFMKRAAELGLPVEGVFHAAREAGRQVVRTGIISGETAEEVSRDLLTRAQYMDYMGPAVERLCERLGKETIA